MQHPQAVLALITPIAIGGGAMVLNPHPAVAAPTVPTAARVAPVPATFGSLTTTSLSSAAPLLQITTVAMALTIFALGVQGVLRGGIQPTQDGTPRQDTVPLELGWNGLPRPQAPEVDEDNGELRFFHAGRLYVVKAA